MRLGATLARSGPTRFRYPARRHRAVAVIYVLLTCMATQSATGAFAQPAQTRTPRILAVDADSGLSQQSRLGLFDEWLADLGDAPRARAGLEYAASQLETGVAFELREMTVREARRIARQVPTDAQPIVRAVGAVEDVAMVFDYYRPSPDTIRLVITGLPGPPASPGSEPIELVRVDASLDDGRGVLTYADTAGHAESVQVDLRADSCEGCTVAGLGTGLALGAVCIPLGLTGWGALACLLASGIAGTGTGEVCARTACRGGYPEVRISCVGSTVSCTVTATIHANSSLNATQRTVGIDLLWIMSEGSCAECWPTDFAWDQRSTTLPFVRQVAGVYQYEATVGMTASAPVRGYAGCAARARAINNTVYSDSAMQTVKPVDASCLV